MKYTIAVLPGDGVGPEVMAEGIKVLQAVSKKFGHEFQLHRGVVGGAAIDAHKVALPQDVVPMCKGCHAVLFGAVGGPKWDDPTAPVRPEQAILGLRKGLNLYANLRPVQVYPMLEDATTLKPEVIHGVDMIVVRELTGGIYFGRPQRRWRSARGRQAVDTLRYSEKEIERVLRTGFELARMRSKKLTSVDKANILDSSRLWRQIATELGGEYPEVRLEHVLVDTAAMRLVRDPASFDVIVTENMFGDILTDEAAVLGGSMGMMASASLGGSTSAFASKRRVRRMGFYEPIHGTAPDIAGKNLANPIGMIRSVALMFQYSLALPREAKAIEDAVFQVLQQGYRTGDIGSRGQRVVGTREMGDQIAGALAGTSTVASAPRRR
ncbi:MAG: 3-isopropylmalate dehydrogenase [Chloroflexi bacterium]|nr:3-isopropylmalate dehydrogenase [Chloroflexota bacterium]